MEEGTVRFAAGMFAEVAEMEALKAQIEAMKADNTERQNHGFSLAWSYEAFTTIGVQLEAIAKKLRAM